MREHAFQPEVEWFPTVRVDGGEPIAATRRLHVDERCRECGASELNPCHLTIPAPVFAPAGGAA